MNRIALYTRGIKHNSVKEELKKSFLKCQHIDVQYYIYKSHEELFYTILKIDSIKDSFRNANELHNKIDFIISIGGDGTFLDSSLFAIKNNIPIIGINTGKLGFLAKVAINEIPEAIEKIVLKREYEIEERVLINLKSQNNDLFKDENFALNELAILKKDSANMITIKAYIDGEYLNTYWADGIIISTPTGSTAYNLSCGGPIVYPNSNNFIITPIAPHNLNVRPIVLPDNSEIKLTIEKEKQYLLNLDSRKEFIYENTELIISKNLRNIKVINLKGQTFLNTIRNKLNWGTDKRN